MSKKIGRGPGEAMKGGHLASLTKMNLGSNSVGEAGCAALAATCRDAIVQHLGPLREVDTDNRIGPTFR